MIDDQLSCTGVEKATLARQTGAVAIVSYTSPDPLAPWVSCEYVGGDGHERAIMRRVLFLSPDDGLVATFAASLLRHDGGAAFAVAAASPHPAATYPLARRCLGLVGATPVPVAGLAAVAARPFDLSITLCDGATAT